MASIAPNKSIKHAIIDKANSTIIASIAVAVFIVVFSAFATKALISQSLYHQRVISEKKEALETAQKNTRTAEELQEAYQAFATETVNVLSGNPTGDGPLDGDNAKIVLDALPSEYDYPALSSSIEKILVDGNYQINSIGGSEDPALQAQKDAAKSKDAKPVEIPYPFSIQTSPELTLILLQTLEKSIRPFYVDSLSISGQENNLSTNFRLKTYYQPPIGLQVGSKEVK